MPKARPPDGPGSSRRRERLRALVVALAVNLAACGGAGVPPDPGTDPDPDPDPCALDAPGAAWLAFVSHRSGDYEIWRARADGRCLDQVTRSAGPDLFPTWAGEEVVFASERGDAQRLWVHDLPTGAETLVETGDLAAATAPAFSPDGSRLAFEGRAPGASRSEIYVVPASGGAPVPIEVTPGGGAGPVWAPDGGVLYLVSPRSGAYEVWAVAAEGGEAVQVTTGSRIVGKPSVTPDAAALVYARTVAGASTTEVVRQSLASGDVEVLSSLDDSEPCVSPDGQLVALRSFRAGHADVVIAARDGSGAVFLTSDVASDGAPTFALPR